MKKILLILLSVMLFSCNKKGEITEQPTEFIEIHGKIYKLMQVTPCYACNPIWIMYPKDSLDRQPQIINYDVNKGKYSVNETIIKVD